MTELRISYTSKKFQISLLGASRRVARIFFRGPRPFPFPHHFARGHMSIKEELNMEYHETSETFLGGHGPLFPSGYATCEPIFSRISSSITSS